MAATGEQTRPGRADLAAVRAVEQEGFALLPEVYDGAAIDDLTAALAPATSGEQAGRSGGAQATRDVLTQAPAVRDAWRTEMLCDLLSRTLGPAAGLVGGTLFDKPPADSWAVPFHKDLTIAVRPGRVDSLLFSLPRVSEGVARVEAPLSVLRGMLSLRIHLDDVTPLNGPLQVLVGSHNTGKSLRVEGFDTAPIYASAGDVLALRPLLAHASGHVRPGTTQHRRVLQLTFAASPDPPDDYAWHEFHAVAEG